MEIGRRIKTLRDEKKISLQEISGILKWPVSKLSKIERGDQGISVGDLQLLVRALNIDIGEVFYNDRNIVLENCSDNYQICLQTDIKYIANSYLTQSENDFSDNPICKIITKKLPKLIVERANINSSNYSVTGSAGKGQFAEIPWIAVFRRSITETATKGIYIVYLYTADMKGIYLSLNQGFTFFREKFGTKKGREEIRKVASFLQRSCNTIPEELKLETIDLKAVGTLGKGYMPGHIAGRYYDVNNLPTDNELIDDLRNLMSVYEEIVGIIGKRTVEQFYNFIIANQNGIVVNDEKLIERVGEIIEKVEEQDEIKYNFNPKDKKDPIKDRKGAEKYPRDPQVAANALGIAGYVCENDKQHITFTRKSNRKNYTEPHHLIPISVHKDFKYSLDIEENVCSLCSTCHNCLHYGIDTEREIILKKLYEERKEMLIKVGLEISFEQLKNYYNIK